MAWILVRYKCNINISTNIISTSINGNLINESISLFNTEESFLMMLENMLLSTMIYIKNNLTD